MLVLPLVEGRVSEPGTAVGCDLVGVLLVPNPRGDSFLKEECPLGSSALGLNFFINPFIKARNLVTVVEHKVRKRQVAKSRRERICMYT